MTFQIARASGSVYVADTVEAGDSTIAVYARAELGVRPDHEVVHLTGKVAGTVDTMDVDRALESTSAQAWPIGTPMCLLPVGEEPAGQYTLSIAHALSSSARHVDLQGCYRRLKVGSEIMWDASVFGEHRGVPDSERGGYYHTVERACEGTTEAAHTAGDTVTVLGPGES